MAHRVSKALADGLAVWDIPTERYVLHSCDNPQCVNPGHLSFGGQQENMDQMKQRGRQPCGGKGLPAKLNADKIREIRRMAKTWDGLCDAMKKHRVSQATISDILAGRTWKHVDG